jgi:molecular chaperone DnaK
MITRKTVGIDLGTTNSVIALLDGPSGEFRAASDEQGQATFPSLIGYSPEQGKLVVGRQAQALRTHARDALTLPLASVKRYMGLERTFAVGPEQLTPPQASALVLRHLRDRMSRAGFDPRWHLDAAIITMPAYFNHNQIEATRRAGELAGYQVVELLHEPTAAALYYSWVERHPDATYLVYDLGGGTFDVSIIRRHLGDFEVLGVSGDPFLGGDDFDRALASHLVARGKWTRDGVPVDADELRALFDPTSADGAVRFARLVPICEQLKMELSAADSITRWLPDVVTVDDRGLTLEATLDRATFQALVREKIVRTVDCCREALGRAKDKAGTRLGDIDHVILVGGSTRVPLVRETVQAAFCRSDLGEHVKNPSPLLHEPDLCVAFGAALRAATHGTRYVFSLAELNRGDSGEVELHWTSPELADATTYRATGIVRLNAPPTEPLAHDLIPGGSVRFRSLATGLVEEAFINERGSFHAEIDLNAEADNPLEATLCDGSGQGLTSTTITVRHQTQHRALARAVLPTQLITKPLQLEVLGRNRQRTKQVVVPVGSPLPGTFKCSCRTQDQAGRIIVPIFEENRIVQQMVIEDLDPQLPIGTPVEVEFAIDVKHAITVQVRVRNEALGQERVESARIDPPPPPRCPTREEIEAVGQRIETVLAQLSGSLRTRMRGRLQQLRGDLLEALGYQDEPRAIQRMAELTDLLQNLENARDQMLDPPWTKFTTLVRECLDLATSVADATGRDRQELFQYIQAQERYAEQAYEDHNQGLYRECKDNLDRYCGYLNRLLKDALPRETPRPTLPPEEEAKHELERFKRFLASVWKEVRAAGREDLEQRLKASANSAQGLGQRIKTEAQTVLGEVRRLGADVAWVQEQLQRKGPEANRDDAGLLEGSS